MFAKTSAASLLPLLLAVASLAIVSAASASNKGPGVETNNETATLKKEVADLKLQVKKLQPDITEAMLTLQIRHARLWFAGESGDWSLAAFQVHGLKDTLDDIVETYPDHAALQPQRLAEILPAMTGQAMKDLRAAIDEQNKASFENAYDRVSAACTGCHAVAGFTFLQIHRPKTPLLDNLSGDAAPAPVPK